MVDTGDLKSLASNGVRVQVPPWAPLFIGDSEFLGAMSADPVWQLYVNLSFQSALA